ncbi:MAG: hypothetical protein Kow001_16850 [Acidobacteriota bacterium]
MQIGPLALVTLLGGASHLSAQSELSFPQIVVGGSFETVVLVANEVAASDTIVGEIFTGEDPPASAGGNPMPVRADGQPPAPVFQRHLEPFQELTIRLSLEEAPARPGWLRLRSTTPGGKITGGILYRNRVGGVVRDSVGVPEAYPQRFSRIQFDDREPGSDTGVAFINPGTDDVQVLIDLYQGEERLAGEAIQLGPREHYARLVHEMFPQAERGFGSLILETSASRPVPMLALRLDGPQITSMAVRPLGLSLRYEIRDTGQALVEAGVWSLDSRGLNLEGTAQRDGSGVVEPLVGIWRGRSFTCVVARSLDDGTTGTLVFNGVSRGEEKSEGFPITGTVVLLDANSEVQERHEFSAFHKF